MSVPTFARGVAGSGGGGYPGVGQGLPGRFPAGRQASGAALGVQSPPFGRQHFPLGGPPGAGAHPEGNLDPSDFPALGVQQQQQQQQPQQAVTSTSTSTTTSITTPTLLSSYASQAGAGAHPSVTNPLTSATTPLQLEPPAANSPSRDDFPALSPFPFPTINMNGQPQQQQQQHHMNPISLLPGGVAPGSRIPPATATGQEQASAMAALQQQQQHRANLLGSMNGLPQQQQQQQQQRQPSGLQQQGQDAAKAFANKPSTVGSQQQHQQQPWASTPPSQHAQPPLNGVNVGGAASSPLPPPTSSSTSELRSPSSSTTAPPPGVTRAVGGTNNSSSALLPPSSGLLPTSLAPQTPADQVLFSPADRYGLLGLLHIIKTTDPDLSMLALGSDLTSLGLDLGATDNLYSTFITPWSDSKAASALNIEPEFHLPSCYNVQPPPAQSKIGNFSDETLFFIFYSQPRDAMQEMAAHELYKHNWRYHKELRLWLTKEAGTEPTQKTSSYERGSYIIFDPTVWERVRKEFVLEFSALESRRG